jgi:hypothetical protein
MLYKDTVSGATKTWRNDGMVLKQMQTGVPTDLIFTVQITDFPSTIDQV